MREISDIMCFWKYEGSGKWHLATSSPIDSCGYVTENMDKLGYETKEKDRASYVIEKWSKRAGRAITIWSLRSGVGLVRLVPPEYPKWLSVSFYEELCKHREWALLLEDGFHLRSETVKEATRYLQAKDGEISTEDC